MSNIVYSAAIHTTCVNLTRKGERVAEIQRTIGIAKETWRRWMDGNAKFRKDILRARTQCAMAEKEEELHDGMAARIALFIRKGMSMSGALRLAGVKPEVYQRRCREEPEFQETIQLAMGELEQSNVKKLKRIAKANPDGAIEKFFLQAHFAAQYTPQVREAVEKELRAVYDKLQRLPPETRIIVFDWLARNASGGDSGGNAPLQPAAAAPVLGPAVSGADGVH